MTSKSLWMSIAVARQAIPLQQDERCDVVIVGSGIAGLSTAYAPFPSLCEKHP
jgi:hypothetical protein